MVLNFSSSSYHLDFKIFFVPLVYNDPFKYIKIEINAVRLTFFILLGSTIFILRQKFVFLVLTNHKRFKIHTFCWHHDFLSCSCRKQKFAIKLIIYTYLLNLYCTKICYKLYIIIFLNMNHQSLIATLIK